MRLIVLLLLISELAFSQNQQMLMRTKVAAAPSFSPNNISGLELWLDGADTDGDFTLNEETGIVSTWYDKSGNGYDFTSSGSPVLVDNGLNSNDYVDFDGSNDYFESDESASSGVWNFLHNGTKNTIFLVLNTGDFNGEAVIVYNTNGVTRSKTGSYFGFDDRNVHPAFLTNSSSFQISNNSIENVILDYLEETIFPNNDYLIRIETDPSNSTTSDRYDFFLNGISKNASNIESASVTTSNSDYTLMIGRENDAPNRYYIGYIAEILMYSKELTPQEISDVETYLNNKWF